MQKALLLLICSVAALTVQTSGQCPTIVVKGPPGLTNSGENVEFRAETNVVGPKLEFRWSVDKGTIIEGQGTKKITVFADPSLAGNTITATVDVDGLQSACGRSASEHAGIAPKVLCSCLDEWGEMKPNDERARLDTFFAELMNSPESVGAIVFRVTSSAKLDSRNSRIRFVLKHIKFRGVDKSRFVFALERAEEKLTRLYRIPPRGDMPPCEGCLWFKGEHL